MVVVIMGVSGVGKSTIGRKLAAAMGYKFVDADDLHPRENIAKMTAGAPLDEDDRRPWLAALGHAIQGWLDTGENVVLACSALRRSHRRVLRRSDGVRFVHLVVPPETLAARLRDRSGHFMPRALLESQLAALEPPASAIAVDGAPSPEVVVARIREELEQRSALGA